MDVCEFEGNADMYGLGIRLGFYLQWYAGIYANMLAIESEIAGNRLALAAFMWGTFIALLVQTIRQALSAIDIYVVLLMCFGYHYFIIPVLLWRLLTCFDYQLDPTRWIVVKASTALNVTNVVLLLATSVYQLWFWISGIHTIPNDCNPVGFLFVKVPLVSVPMWAVNVALQCVLICVGLLGPVRYLFKIGGDERQFLEDRQVEVEKRKAEMLLRLRSVLTSTVAAIFVVATELSISWNHITGVQDLSSAGQLIPFFLGVVIFLHVPWTYYKERRAARAEAARRPPQPPREDPDERSGQVKKKYYVTDPQRYQQQPTSYYPPGDPSMASTSSYTISNSLSMPSPQYQAPPPRQPVLNAYTISDAMRVGSPAEISSSPSYRSN